MFSVTFTGMNFLAVVDAEGQADELRHDRRAARPGPMTSLRTDARAFDLPDQASRRRTGLPNGTCHRPVSLSVSARVAAADDDKLSVALLVRVFLPLVGFGPTASPG